MEIWKDIPGFEGTHQVSNLGNFKALKRMRSNGRVVCLYKEKIMKPNLEGNGYYQIQIFSKPHSAHRLVAKAFIPNPKNKEQINHKNGIKTDNRVENLEWLTRSENCKHSFVIGLQCNKGENHPSHKVTAEIVREIRAKYIPNIYTSRRLAKEYRLSKTNILDIVNRKIWNHI